MDERSILVPPESVPRAAPSIGTASADGSAASSLVDDPRALTILTTEHYSLMTARSLVYNEAFARGGMFLSFLSATLVALGLVATATGFSDAFLLVAAVVLGLDLFVGYATLGRIGSASGEDIRYLQAMNRIRHAYVELSPGVAPYFMTGHHDDVGSVLSVYGPGPAISSGFAAMRHGFTTTPGMIGVICSAVAGALAAVLVLLLRHDSTAAGTVAIGAFLVSMVVLLIVNQRTVGAFWTTLEVRHPRS